MRITFVAIGWEQLAVSQLAAIAKQHGHEVRLAFSVSLFHDRYNLSVPSLAPLFDDRRDVLAAIERQRPDVLAFSALTGTYHWMLGIARDAKRLFPGVKVVFGGVHVSAVPDRALANPQVDYVVVGEGDVAFPQILDAIAHGGPGGAPLPNTRYKTPDGRVVKGPQTGFIQDLDALPMQDKTIWEEHIRVGDVYFTMASRGCPYRCTFCFNNFFARLPEGQKGRYVRQRSVDSMIRELRWARKRYDLKIVDFEDDVFTVDKAWVKAFLERYRREIGVPFQCLTHPRYMDDDVARWLAEAGCRYIQMGIQTMDDDYKFNVIKRYEKSAHVERAMELMARYGIKAKVDHMFGLPGEPLEAQEKALALYKRHPPYRIQTFWTNFLPGTEMVDQGLAAGLVTPGEMERMYDGLDFDFYRNSTRIESPEKERAYKAYEVMYKLVPFLPRWLRRRLKVRAFLKFPAALSAAITFVTDVAAGLITRNPDHVGYAKHYLFHIYRFFARKAGLRVPPATRRLDLSKPASGPAPDLPKPPPAPAPVSLPCPDSALPG